MRIALYAHAHRPGGLLGSLGRLAAGLAAGGDEVLALLHPDPAAGEAAAEAEAAGAEVGRLEVRGGSDLKGLAALRRALVRFRPRVVHLHLSAPAESTAALAVARSVGARAVLASQHAPGWWPRRSLYGRLALRASGWIAHRTAAVCRADRRRLCEDMGLPEGRVVVLSPVPPPPARPAPAGALRTLLGVGPEQLLVGTHGAVDLSKGSDVFVEAAGRSGRPEVVWVLMGDGPLLKELRERAGEEGRLRFTGWRDDAASLLGDLDLYVLPSRTEGLPLALLEAMAAGRPAVATAVGGVPEVLGAAGGRLVPPEDPEALASAVDALLGDPVERDLLGRALARAATAYRAESVVRGHRRLYRALAGEEEP